MDQRRSAASKRAPQQEQAPVQQAQSQQKRQPAPQAQKGKETKKGSNAFMWFTIFMLFASCIAMALLPNDFGEVYVIGGARNVKKQISNFNDFYQFYLTEHSDITNRILHFIGTSLVLLTGLFEPILIHCVLIATCFGYIASTLFAGNLLQSKLDQTGVLEAAVFLFTFLFFAMGNKVFKKAIFVLVLGYAFAWVGHFHYEHNYPATFVYPTYSLMSDVKMWFDMVTGVVPGLDQFCPVVTELTAPMCEKLQPVIKPIKPYYHKAVEAVYPHYKKVCVALEPHVETVTAAIRPLYLKAKEFVLAKVAQ